VSTLIKSLFLSKIAAAADPSRRLLHTEYAAAASCQPDEEEEGKAVCKTT
jgi:hypothetical protein